MFVKYICASLVLLVSLVGGVIAQDTDQPLILLKTSDQYDMGVGDLWEWTGGPALRQKTQWGYNEELRLSPLNDEVAYHSWARLWVDYIEQNSMTSGGRFPGNIWVITTASTDLGTRVGDQPADASINSDGIGANTLLRSAPMWSSDGTQIAWAERREIAFEAPEPYRLVIYDKATQTTRTLVEALPEQYGIDTGIEGYWMGDSIVILSDPEQMMGDGGAFLVFDARTGEKRFNIPLFSFAETKYPWPELTTAVQYQGQTWLGVLQTFADTPAEWHIINLTTGEIIVPSSAVPTALIASHRDTSIRVQIHFASEQETLYTVTNPDGSPLPLGLNEEQFVRKFALSPDGQAIAYQIYDRAADTHGSSLFVWRDGVVTEVPETADSAIVSEFVWGTAAWVIDLR